jgi:hypothetical protein
MKKIGKKSKPIKKRSIGAPAVSIDLVGNLPTKPLWVADPLIIINQIIKTVRTQQHVTGTTNTFTARNEIQVDFVGKTDATSETVVEHRFG